MSFQHLILGRFNRFRFKPSLGGGNEGNQMEVQIASCKINTSENKKGEIISANEFIDVAIRGTRKDR